MFISEIQKARSRMRLAIGIVVLAVAAGAITLWASGAVGNSFSTGVLLAAGLGIVVAAWVARGWLRNRQRRRLMEMQDSALW